MKRVNTILLVAVFLVAATVGYSGTVDSPYEVGTWRGFRQAAVTYTFDDNCSNQFAIAIPMFNEFGFTLTMYPVINWSPDWAALKAAADKGHEIGSHTVSHSKLSELSREKQKDELEKSQEIINAKIPGQKCLTIAYPYCVTCDKALCEEYYIAARGCQGFVEKSTPGDFMNISSIICGSQGAVKTTANFISKNTSAANSNGWVVYLIHGIDSDGGYSPLPSTTLKESLEYLDDNRDIYWASTFFNAARYIKERDAVSVTELSGDEAEITLQATDTLDDSIYNYPITIRRPLPENWTNADVSQNDQSANSSVVEIESAKYIMFDVVPDGGKIVISKTQPK